MDSKESRTNSASQTPSEKQEVDTADGMLADSNIALDMPQPNMEYVTNSERYKYDGASLTIREEGGKRNGKWRWCSRYGRRWCADRR